MFPKELCRSHIGGNFSFQFQVLVSIFTALKMGLHQYTFQIPGSVLCRHQCLLGRLCTICTLPIFCTRRHHCLSIAKTSFFQELGHLKGQVDNLLMSVSHTTYLHDKQVHSLKVIHHCCSDPNVSNYVDLYTEVVS